MSCTPPPSNSSAIADTGCTGNFLLISSPSTNKRIAATGINVNLPNGEKIQSTHTCLLDLPQLPLAARKAHIFPGLASNALLSIGMLCDNGCDAIFTSTNVTIRHGNSTISKASAIQHQDSGASISKNKTKRIQAQCPPHPNSTATISTRRPPKPTSSNSCMPPVSALCHPHGYRLSTPVILQRGQVLPPTLSANIYQNRPPPSKVISTNKEKIHGQPSAPSQQPMHLHLASKLRRELTASTPPSSTQPAKSSPTNQVVFHTSRAKATSISLSCTISTATPFWSKL